MDQGTNSHVKEPLEVGLPVVLDYLPATFYDWNILFCED